MLSILLITAFVLFVVHFMSNCNTTARAYWKIQGPPGKFLVGNAWDIILSPEELFKLGRAYAKTYKSFYRFWCYPFGSLNLYNPEDLEIILSNSKFNEKSIIYKFLRPWLRTGLLLSNGSKWLQRRKILTPAFHFSILRHFTEILEDNSHRLADELVKNGASVVDVVPLSSDFTLHSICETAMGTRLDGQKTEAGKQYKLAIYVVAKFLVERFTKVHFYFDFIYNLSRQGREQKKYLETIHSFTGKVIKDRKEMIEKKGVHVNAKLTDDLDSEDVYMYSKRNKIAMLDLLISAEKEGSVDEIGIQEEVDTFMFEGHDTTASGLQFILLMLANNKNCQIKVEEEIREVFGNSQSKATMQDLVKLKYLDCCIKETLRLYPPVPFISRTISEPVTLTDCEVPAGCIFHIHIFDLHRREDLFEDPLSFNPDRFLPENSIGRHPYSYIPFSAGSRNCIGQRFAILELKSVVATLLKKFHLEAVTKPEDVVFLSDVVLRTRDPIHVKFVKRNQ